MDYLNIEKIHFTEALKYFANNKNILCDLNDLMNKTLIDEISIENTKDKYKDDKDDSGESTCESDMSTNYDSSIMSVMEFTMDYNNPFEGSFYIALIPNTDVENNNKIVVGFVTIILADTFYLYTQKSTSNINVADSIYSISGVGVDFKYRNNGICSKLLKRIINDFPTVDIYLSVFPGNIAAFTCYKKIGFVENQDLEDKEDPIKYMTLIHHKKLKVDFFQYHLPF